MMCISLHYFISLASSSNGVLFVNPPLQCFGRSSIAIFVGPESCNRGLTKVLQRCFGHFWPVCTFIHTLALQYMLCTLFATYRPLPPALCRESNASGLRSLAWCGAHVWNCWIIVGNSNRIGIRNRIRIGIRNRVSKKCVENKRQRKQRDCTCYVLQLPIRGSACISLLAIASWFEQCSPIGDWQHSHVFTYELMLIWSITCSTYFALQNHLEWIPRHRVGKLRLLVRNKVLLLMHGDTLKTISYRNIEDV